MNGAMRTASFTVHRNSFFRVGVVEPDKYDIPAAAPRYCPCGRRLAKGNKGELCRRHEEIERRLRLKAFDLRRGSKNTVLGGRADKKHRCEPIQWERDPPFTTKEPQ